MKSVLASLLALACAVGGALYAQRVLRENRERVAREPQGQQAPTPQEQRMQPAPAPQEQQAQQAPAPQAQPAPAP